MRETLDAKFKSSMKVNKSDFFLPRQYCFAPMGLIRLCTVDTTLLSRVAVASSLMSALVLGNAALGGRIWREKSLRPHATPPLKVKAHYVLLIKEQIQITILIFGESPVRLLFAKAAV